MKKITMKAGILWKLLFIFAIAQGQKSSTSPYQNWMDTIGVRDGLIEHTQFYLGGNITLTRDTIPYEGEWKKNGSWIIHDRRIFFERGMYGVLDKVEVKNGQRIIWVKFKKKVKGVTTEVALPFASNGPGKNNAFVVYVTYLGGKQIAFKYKGTDDTEEHSYEVDGTATLEIPAELVKELVKAQSIKIHNK